jgi:hypothetical protein
MLHIGVLCVFVQDLCAIIMLVCVQSLVKEMHQLNTVL